MGAAAVALVVFQTPPLTAPMYTIAALVGFGAMALIAPLISLFGGSASWALAVGPGPSATQADAGARRSSSRSRLIFGDFHRERGLGLTRGRPARMSARENQLDEDI